MKTQISEHYQSFKFLKGNRPIVPNKIKKLIDSVNGGLNLFQYCPILVNEKMYVIDGQHRLETCKKLKLPVYYCVVPGITLLQIAKLNACASRWKISDFFNCFIETGNKDYETLQSFQLKWGLSITDACSLLMNGSVAAAGGRDVFTEGKFQVRHLQKAEKLMKAVSEYSPVADDKLIRSRHFIRAVALLLVSPKYQHSEVVNKLAQRKTPISEKLNYKEYIFHIEELPQPRQ